MKPMGALKKITSIMNTIENVSLKKDISELYSSFQEMFEKNMELRERITELKEEITTLKEKNSILEKELERQESVEFRDGAYWAWDGKGPYCQVCFDTKGKLIQTSKIPGRNAMKCPVCKYEYETAKQREENKIAQESLLNTIYDLNK